MLEFTCIAVAIFGAAGLLWFAYMVFLSKRYARIRGSVKIREDRGD